MFDSPSIIMSIWETTLNNNCEWISSLTFWRIAVNLPLQLSCYSGKWGIAVTYKINFFFSRSEWFIIKEVCHCELSLVLRNKSFEEKYLPFRIVCSPHIFMVIYDKLLDYNSLKFPFCYMIFNMSKWKWNFCIWYFAVHVSVALRKVLSSSWKSIL